MDCHKQPSCGSLNQKTKNDKKKKKKKKQLHSSTMFGSSHHDDDHENINQKISEVEQEQEQEYQIPPAKKCRLIVVETNNNERVNQSNRNTRTTGIKDCKGVNSSSRSIRNTSSKTPRTPNGSINEDLNPFILISKADHDATLKLLKSMDWTMAKNTSRRNVIREDEKSTPRNEMGKPYCMSFIFGRNMKDPTGSLSYWSSKYPHVYNELQNLMHKYDPNFPYTHITLNYNLQCKRHTDGGNVGPSYIAAFGDFQGGELIVEVNRPLQNQGMKNKNGTMDQYLDLKSRFVKFNGKTQRHETAPFTGERYTLVYYTSDIVPPTVDRRQVSSTVKDPVVVRDSETLNPNSALAQKFHAIKAKLGHQGKNKNKKRSS